VVQPGESLGSIAQRYGTSTSALAAANGISDPNMVLAGTRLRISGRLAASSSGMTQGPLNPITAATHGWGAHPGKGEVSALISRYASRHGVDPSLVRAIGWQESGFWQGARSSTGAVGVMQLMPGTASWAGPALLGRQIDPHDVHDNVETGAAYIAYLQRQTGSRRLTIASYYQGWGSVSSRGLYGETESYVSSVSSFIGRV
jgi:soluble lytic murein transglycosylase-like protein